MYITHFKKTLIYIQTSFTIYTLFLTKNIKKLKPLNNKKKSNNKFHNKLIKIIKIKNI